MSGEGEAERDAAVLEVLRDRDGRATVVHLAGGQVCTVFDIAWGYDIGDVFAHVTTNVSPGRPDLPIDFFFTSEVEALFDPELPGVDLLAAGSGAEGGA